MITFNKTMMDSLLDNEGFCRSMFNMARRWNDESLYEDINDYGKTLEGILNGIFKTGDFTGHLKMTKRPFGFIINAPYMFNLKGGGQKAFPAKIQVKMCLSSGEISFKVSLNR